MIQNRIVVNSKSTRAEKLRRAIFPSLPNLSRRISHDDEIEDQCRDEMTS